MGNIGSSPADNNWYYQSFFADTDYCKMISEFTFTFIVKPTKLKQHEFEEQLYNK